VKDAVVVGPAAPPRYKNATPVFPGVPGEPPPGNHPGIGGHEVAITVAVDVSRTCTVPNSASSPAKVKDGVADGPLGPPK